MLAGFRPCSAIVSRPAGQPTERDCAKEGGIWASTVEEGDGCGGSTVALAVAVAVAVAVALAVT